MLSESTAAVFPIVGIGASAGGLEALEQFSAMPLPIAASKSVLPISCFLPLIWEINNSNWWNENSRR